MLRSRLVHAFAGTALLAVPLFLFSQRVHAIQDSEDKVWFGPVGIAPGERALVNIYAIGNPNEIGTRTTPRGISSCACSTRAARSSRSRGCSFGPE